MTLSCSTCRAFKVVDDDTPGQGVCRLNPPQIVVTEYAMVPDIVRQGVTLLKAANFQSIWPLMSAEHGYCEQHQVDTRKVN